MVLSELAKVIKTTRLGFKLKNAVALTELDKQIKGYGLWHYLS